VLRSRMAGVKTCCRLKASNCLVKEAALSPAFSISRAMLAQTIARAKCSLQHSTVANNYSEEIVEVVRDPPRARPIASIFCAILSCRSSTRFSVTSSQIQQVCWGATLIVDAAA